MSDVFRERKKQSAIAAKEHNAAVVIPAPFMQEIIPEAKAINGISKEGTEDIE